MATSLRAMSLAYLIAIVGIALIGMPLLAAIVFCKFWRRIFCERTEIVEMNVSPATQNKPNQVAYTARQYHRRSKNSGVKSVGHCLLLERPGRQ